LGRALTVGQNLADGEFPVGALDSSTHKDLILIYTKKGYGKLVNKETFLKSKRIRKIISLKPDDSVIGFIDIHYEDEVVVYSNYHAFRFIPSKEIRISNLGSGGVKIIRLNKDTDLKFISQTKENLVLYAEGYMRSDFSENYPLLKRGARGVKCAFKKHILACVIPIQEEQISKEEDLILMTEDGFVLRIAVPEMRSGRANKGLKSLSLNTGDRISLAQIL
jgi:DNA gyrase/topoisomerase IV subunit A